MQLVTASSTDAIILIENTKFVSSRHSQSSVSPSLNSIFCTEVHLLESVCTNGIISVIKVKFQNPSENIEHVDTLD